MRIAVVEDDPELGEYFQELLRREGFKTVLYPTPGRFLDSLLKAKPDVVLLDMNLPGMDGKDLLRVLRGNPGTRDLLVIGMSGCQKSSSDAVKGFQAGVDEYLVKPIEPELLLVRLQSLIRRGRLEPAEEVLQLDSLTLKPAQRICRVGDEAASLTRLEFDLLEYFLRHANRVLTRSTLLESVWKGDPTMTTKTVNKHVETLRRKLGPAGARIETIIRVGYVLRT